MKSLTVDTLIAIASLLLALCTTTIGAILWFSNSEKKKYAAERDFAHLRRNQEQISQGIAMISDELDRRFDIVERDILEIKTTLNINFKHHDK